MGRNWLCGVCCVVALGCAAESGSGSIGGGAVIGAEPKSDAGVQGDDLPAGACSQQGIACIGNTAVTCAGREQETGRVDCTTSGLVCVSGQGCARCAPGSRSCEGNAPRTCNDEGTGWTMDSACDAAAGEVCIESLGACSSLCEAARASNSYIGCDYWAAPVLNSQLDAAFDFAVVAANPQEVQALVTVSRGGVETATVSVAPGAVEAITLPYVAPLKGAAGSEATALVRNGAYRVTSNVPVTVYQFNPLDFEVSGPCEAQGSNPLDTSCFSFTNDASLLLPDNVLSGNYMVMARAPIQNDVLIEDVQLFSGERTVLEEAVVSIPGYFAVVATEASEVTIDFAGATGASADGTISAYAAGEQGTFTMNAGDVLQFVTSAPETCVPDSTPPTTQGLASGNILVERVRTDQACLVGPEFDLTGSVISSTGAVSVIGGHNCAFVPSNIWACDHLEEALFPLEAWGSQFVVSVTEQQRTGEPNIVRVLSAADNNQLTFEPASVVSQSVVLNRGESFEFQTTSDLQVTGTGPLMVGQFLVGQNFSGTVQGAEVGDPSFSLAIPTEQFRDSYTFLAPSTYTQNYVNVVSPVGASVMLDGQVVSGFVSLPGTDMMISRIPVTGGRHEVAADQPVGIVVYGFGLFTSYMYPGGLDLKEINIF